MDGQDQLVVFMQQEIGGFDPNNGDELWRHPHPTEYGLNISTPVWGDGNLLFCSSAYNGGSRVLRLERKEGKTTANELWFNNRMRIHIGNRVRSATMCMAQAAISARLRYAIEVKTGKILWQDRSSPRGFLYAAGSSSFLPRRHLALATASPRGEDSLKG